MFVGLDVDDIHKRKGLEAGQKILDYMGSTEIILMLRIECYFADELKYLIHLAYYAAAHMYMYKVCFEKTAGKGYVDCIMLPQNNNMQGIVIE